MLPILASPAALAAVGCVALAGSLAAPGAGAIVAGTAAVAGRRRAQRAPSRSASSALVGSRGPVIGIMLAFYLAVAACCSAIGFLGGARQLAPDVATRPDRRPRRERRTCTSALGAAIARRGRLGRPSTLGAGAWRTRTREI